MKEVISFDVAKKKSGLVRSLSEFLGVFGHIGKGLGLVKIIYLNAPFSKGFSSPDLK